MSFFSFLGTTALLILTFMIFIHIHSLLLEGLYLHSLAPVKVYGTKWIKAQMKEQTHGCKHIFSGYAYCFVVYQEKFYHIVFVYSSRVLYICTM